MACFAIGRAKWSGPPSLRIVRPQPKPSVPSLTSERARTGVLWDRGKAAVMSESGTGPYLPCVCVHFYAILQYADDEPEVRQTGPREA